MKKMYFERFYSSNFDDSSLAIDHENVVSNNNLMDAYQTLNTRNLCGAQCVIIQSPTPEAFQFNSFQLNTQIYNHILPEEIEFGKIKEKSNDARLNKFIGGRIALRRAFDILQVSELAPIMRDSWGAPILPMHLTGSISHKDYYAVGVAAIDDKGRVGVDIERCNNKAATTLQRRIITDNERATLGKLPNIPIEEDILLRFSFKESVYKAIHPFLPRSIDFAEVEVYPSADGTADLKFLLKTKEIFNYKASWFRFRDIYWVTCVYVSDPSTQYAKYR
jgi:phosphopantetheine--protein transferase-like protein